ncbi:hypothetical protein GGTG_13349 [Gaeumannomyces tritici R3-111a-1]|uniref:Uncharacterized protein n=1 Tax=Gaeumannomyces tritici (strain R3-111a-1) TaxID=644352 RepID=J3PIM0_GAET3|nr:hypothetical protein GGTG_13349 [Gaeumannomyces tritici R3-111a-1]EJT69081.1 hypothetical protein GGTG_13349 [Gaeumannomyces tritici R3-111a-1]
MHHRRGDKQRRRKSSKHQRKHSQSSPVDLQLPPHGTTSPCTISEQRAAYNPELERKLKQMAIPLTPLVQITTGHIHPAFPMTLLNYWLLTDDQLESLAHFYHQRTLSFWTSQYPHPVQWGSKLPIEEKRRRIGKFIGLGCETPITLKTAEELLNEARREAAIADHADDILKRKFGF